MAGDMLKATRALCPHCLKAVNASIVSRQDRIYLLKDCPQHGRFEVPHFWSDPGVYNLMSRLYEKRKKSTPIGMLINLTLSCNQNCNYCFAWANQRVEPPPTLQEIIERIRHYRGLYIYLCGGEPTLRWDLFAIIQELKKRGFKIVLLTNGKRLVERSYVRDLGKAGLDFVQMQFDTFDDRQYEVLRNERLLDVKLKAIENLRRTRMRLNLWVTLVKGINADQIGRIIKYAAQNSSLIKNVYLISAWSVGRTLGLPALSKEEVLNIIDRELNIAPGDFMDYKAFEHYLLEICGTLSHQRWIRSTPCNINCRIFCFNGYMRLLSDFIDLKKITSCLAKAYNMSEDRDRFSRIQFLKSICRISLLKELLVNRGILSLPLGYRRSFSIRVGSFVDRHNLDFEFFKNCNLCTDFQGGNIPFCLKEIKRGQ
jgi:uncharacterized radical SAM superfamily Fe-S cluster-containing enzyme